MKRIEDNLCKQEATAEILNLLNNMTNVTQPEIGEIFKLLSSIGTILTSSKNQSTDHFKVLIELLQSNLDQIHNNSRLDETDETTDEKKVTEDAYNPNWLVIISLTIVITIIVLVPVIVSIIYIFKKNTKKKYYPLPQEDVENGGADVGNDTDSDFDRESSWDNVSISMPLDEDRDASSVNQMEVNLAYISNRWYRKPAHFGGRIHNSIRSARSNLYESIENSRLWNRPSVRSSRQCNPNDEEESRGLLGSDNDDNDKCTNPGIVTDAECRLEDEGSVLDGQDTTTTCEQDDNISDLEGSSQNTEVKAFLPGTDESSKLRGIPDLVMFENETAAKIPATPISSLDLVVTDGIVGHSSDMNDHILKVNKVPGWVPTKYDYSTRVRKRKQTSHLAMTNSESMTRIEETLECAEEGDLCDDIMQPDRISTRVSDASYATVDSPLTSNNSEQNSNSPTQHLNSDVHNRMDDNGGLNPNDFKSVSKSETKEGTHFHGLTLSSKLNDNDDIYDYPCDTGNSDSDITDVKTTITTPSSIKPVSCNSKQVLDKISSSLRPLQSSTPDGDNYQVALDSISSSKINTNDDESLTQGGIISQNGAKNNFQDDDPFKDKEDCSKTDPKVTVTSEDEENTSNNVTPIDDDPIYDCFGDMEYSDMEAKEETGKELPKPDYEKLTKLEDKQPCAELFPSPQSFHCDEDNYEVAPDSKTNNDGNESTTQGRNESENIANKKYRQNSGQEDDPFSKVDNEPYPDYEDKVDGSGNSFQDLENKMATDPKVAATSEDEENTDKFTPIDKNPIYDCFGATEDPDMEVRDKNSNDLLKPDYDKQQYAELFPPNMQDIIKEMSNSTENTKPPIQDKSVDESDSDTENEGDESDYI